MTQQRTIGRRCVMHDFRRLRVWHEARALGTVVYAICSEKGRSDQLITTQLRRSALSIATNIAEGCGKNSRAETIRYFEIASGSAAETEHHLEVACDVGVLSTHRATPLIERTATVRRMLDSLIVRLPK
jgi:four helix bundle protein